MTITERTLRKWRKEALVQIEYIKTKAVEQSQVDREIEIQVRVLHLTQELLEQHLLRK